MGRRVADQRRLSVERIKGIYAKGWETENGDNSATSWYTSSNI